jgi:ribose/xylose/arabinose/galactoside ABC-type transport system permease subunit
MVDAQPRAVSHSWIGALRAQLIGSRTIGLALVLVLVCVVFAITAPGFATTANLTNIARASSVFGVAALGITIAMGAGAIDLSFGAVMSLGGIATASALTSGTSALVAIGIGIGLGAVLGLVNGALVAWLRIDTMVVTLGTMSVFGGIAFFHTNAQRTSAPGDAFAEFGRGFVLGVPNAVWVLVGVAAVLAFVLRTTVFAQTALLIGDNPRAAALTRLPVARVRTLALVISGMAAGLAGILVTANAGLIYPGTGERFLLPALAAVVVGGTALRGGHATIVGTVLGIALLGVIDNGLNLLSVPGVWQDVARGGILVGALALDSWTRSR